MEESLPTMVDDRVKEHTKIQVLVYVAQGLIMERQQSQVDVTKMIADAIQQECKNIRFKISFQIIDAIFNHIRSQIDSSAGIICQLQQDDLPIWLAVKYKFERLHMAATPCRPSSVRLKDQDDPHDNAYLKGEKSAKRQKTSKHGTFVFGESSSGQDYESKLGPSTSGNQEQLDDFDFWTDSYATDDDEIPTEKVSQELVDEMSHTIDEAKLRKVVNEMLRQRCTSGDEHQYHIDQMQKFLKSDIVWERKKEILVSPHPQRYTIVVQSCQRDPKAPALSLELRHEHKFITRIVERRANGSIVSITESDYKNLNKNDIEDAYLLIVNRKVDDYAETGIENYKVFSIVSEPVYGIIDKNNKKKKRVMRHQEVYKLCDAMLKRVLEGLKSYNHDVKHGSILVGILPLSHSSPSYLRTAISNYGVSLASEKAVSSKLEPFGYQSPMLTKKYTVFCQESTLRFDPAFWFCDLQLRFGFAFCSLKTVIVFFLRKTLPVLKLGCVLSQDFVAFCLKNFLRFVSRPLRFVSRLGCVLSQDLLHFVLRHTAFCLKIVAFYLQASCVLSTFEDLFLRFEDMQCAGSDTRPPMLDRTDFASWQQCIRLYCRGKENGVNILKSIDEGPYQMGTVREPLAEGTEGAPQFGPERPRDIYTLVNHYTDAKDIWDNVKMLLEGSELTKEDHESQLYDDFEHLRQHKGDFIHDYYVQFAKLINDMRNIKMTMSRMQLNSKFVNNMLPEWGRFVTANFQGRQNRGKGMNLRGGGSAGYMGVQNRVGNVNPGQARQVDDCDAFDSDVDEAPTIQTMFMANLSSADLVTDEAGPSYDSDILSEVQDHDHYQDTVCAHHEEHAMHDNVQLNHVGDSHVDYTSNSNMILYDQYVKDNEVPVVHSNVSSIPKDAFMMIYNDMCEPHAQSFSNPSRNTVVENSLTAKLATYKEQVELPKPYYNELNKVAIGYKNPLCLTRAKQVQPALYNGHEILKDNHVLAIVHNTEDTLEIAEITRKKINDQMKDTKCVTRKVKIAPHEYSKENFLATFTP
nr:hypothetical protein [Tanacetum cinerariifolium]